MKSFNLIAQTNESTVVAEYTPAPRRLENFQSEADLEKELIRLLCAQGYAYLPIHNEEALIQNLKKQLEALNHYTFTQDEWKRFFKETLANRNEGVVQKSKSIQRDHVKVLKREDGSSKNIRLIDKEDLHNNVLQVINQYEEKQGTHSARYDVTILVNGLPMAHVELKRRGVAVREAFNQIQRYQRESFWASCGLFEYIQIFIISNGTHTRYYSNTTRENRLQEATGKEKRKKTSHSFEFTSTWADGKNKPILDLTDFAQTFLAKHSFLNILTKFCVLTEADILLVMRPYQISATERILNRIKCSTHHKKTGTLEAGGYIWHTTGSGKTLTSFKTAQLASALPDIKKVLFVVDRKDLDYQTMQEYKRFQEGCANINTSTRILQAQLEDPNAKIIITTIQKLGRFVAQNKNHPVMSQHCVIIFDECHRSQFGEMHKKIVHAFKNYHLFGFTGTPIFARNTGKQLNTTQQTFGDSLHTYTILNAINDQNVLPFRVDYVNTLKEKENITDKKVLDIDTEKAMESPERIAKIVDYVLEHFDQQTKRNSTYPAKGKNNFNSLFATSSIPMAKEYYTEFQKQIKEKKRNLNVAVIFSYTPNEDTEDFLAEEDFETNCLDNTSRNFLEDALKNYNQRHHTNFDTSSESFQNYYKDVSQRVKNGEVDILIVVNMFLTGFDATTLNTLWVDKNLKMHGLIQAFSRTNRIFNSVKTFGNIVCFRNLQKETEEALSLFGDENASGIVLLRNFEDYFLGFKDAEGRRHPGYVELLEELKEKFPLGVAIQGEETQKAFIQLFGQLLTLRNILSSFDPFNEKDPLSARDLQDYQSHYLDIYERCRKKTEVEKEDITDDLEFEIELIKQVDINIDYILILVERYRAQNCKNEEIFAHIKSQLESSVELRNKKELIHAFIQKINAQTQIESDWQKFVKEEKEKELNEIIQSENLHPEKTKKFIVRALGDGVFKTAGKQAGEILNPVSRFDGERKKKKDTALQKLNAFFEKYLGLGA